LTHQHQIQLTHQHPKSLQIGDRVVFTGSTVDEIGTIVALLDEDYLRVKWGNSPVATTHRRHAVELPECVRSPDDMVCALS
jgi:hypothetical protein